MSGQVKHAHANHNAAFNHKTASFKAKKTMTSSNSNSKPVGVGIAGLGRSGWNIHGKHLQNLPNLFRITAVMDTMQDRLDEANNALGCAMYSDYDAMLADSNVDLIVVATPNPLHTEHAISAMQAGKHVVCEKPFAMNVGDADKAIAVSEQTSRILAPFQNRRFEPHFLKVKEIIDSGALGTILQIRMTWHGFNRRWDWQTLKQYGGGLLNNNGAHLLDHTLALLNDPNPEIFADLKRGLSSGDTEDHIKLIFKNHRNMTIDVELSSVIAFEQDRWHISGTQGGLTGSVTELNWKTVDWSTMPSRPVESDPRASNRSYNSEEIRWTQHHWQEPQDSPNPAIKFYENLHDAITQNQPLVVTPQSARHLIHTLNKCHELCPTEFEIAS